MCCDSYQEGETVGECPDCGARVDADGFSTEVCCTYSPIACETCKDSPCDGSC